MQVQAPPWTSFESLTEKKQIPGCGIGLFATVDIPIWTLIIDRPIWIAIRKPSEVNSGSHLIDAVLTSARMAEVDPVKFLNDSFHFTCRHSGDLLSALRITDDELKELSLKHGLTLQTVIATARVISAYNVEFGTPRHGSARALYRQIGLINHSCDPNCMMTVQEEHALCVVLRPIQKGEQLTLNYKSAKLLVTYHHNFAKYDLWTMFNGLCKCQSPFCVHRGLSDDSIAPAQNIHDSHSALANTMSIDQIMDVFKEGEKKREEKSDTPGGDRVLEVTCRVQMELAICIFDALTRQEKPTDNDGPAKLSAALYRILQKYEKTHFHNVVPSDVLCLLDAYRQFLVTPALRIDGKFCSIPSNVLHTFTFGTTKEETKVMSFQYRYARALGLLRELGIRRLSPIVQSTLPDTALEQGFAVHWVSSLDQAAVISFLRKTNESDLIDVIRFRPPPAVPPPV
jgi:hypothetical protein